MNKSIQMCMKILFKTHYFPLLAWHRSLHRQSQADRALHHPLQLLQQPLLLLQSCLLILQLSALFQSFLQDILLSHLLVSLRSRTLGVFTTETGSIHACEMDVPKKVNVSLYENLEFREEKEPE